MKQIFECGLWFRGCLEIQRNKINLFSITLELFVEIDISEELFLFFRAYTEKGVKVRLLILVYESQSTFHSWRENMEQLLTSVTLWVLAPLPGRKENTCRVCLYALAGCVTLSSGFFSIFEFCNANRTDLPITVCLLQGALTPTFVCQQHTWGWCAPACSCFPAASSPRRVRGEGTRWCISQSRWRLQARRPSEFRDCHARISA